MAAKESQVATPSSESGSAPPIKLPQELSTQVQADIARLRALTMEQRGQMIDEACRLARLIEDSKVKQGFPPTAPAPWPASTWEFLRKHAPNGKR
jgi:hypothetical protein